MKRFGYYSGLTAGNKKVYRSSDRITVVKLTDLAGLVPSLKALEAALLEEDRGRAEVSSQELADGISRRLGVPRVQVITREVRPSDSNEELHGLYEPVDPPYRCRISLWMRTAVRGEVVAYKTFLRTLLHELCHHLDYELFAFPESFHTRGFYQRESSLMRQLTEAGDRFHRAEKRGQ